MVINFKDKFYICNSDNNFSEEDIKKLLEEAYNAGHKDGYDAGYSAGLGSKIFYPIYPYPSQPYYWNSPTCTSDKIEVTCNNPTSTSKIYPPTSFTSWATSDKNNNNINKIYEAELKNGRDKK